MTNHAQKSEEKRKLPPKQNIMSAFHLSEIYMKYLLIIIGLSLLGCGIREDDPAEIVFGVYCGECHKDCSTMTRVTADRSTVDTTYSFFYWLFEGKKNGGNYESLSNVGLSHKTHQLIKGILKEVPSNMNKYEERIGCPDCADDCGIYLRVENRQWLIEPKEYTDPELSRFVHIAWSYDSIVRREVFR